MFHIILLCGAAHSDRFFLNFLSRFSRVRPRMMMIGNFHIAFINNFASVSRG